MVVWGCKPVIQALQSVDAEVSFLEGCLDHSKFSLGNSVNPCLQTIRKKFWSKVLS